MSSIYYLDNSAFVVDKRGTFYTTRRGIHRIPNPIEWVGTLLGGLSSSRANFDLSAIAASSGFGQGVRFHDFHFSAFSLAWKGWFPQLVLSCLGIFLISISFFPGFVLARGSGTISVSNYPPRVAENTSNAPSAPATTSSVTTAAVAANEVVAPVRAVNNTPVFSGNRGWPVRGGISSYFSAGHPAIDIAASYGTSVGAFADGVVSLVSYQAWGFGNHIVIRHADGTQTIYAHLSSINVAKGQTVKAGGLIGRVGSSGLATGPHLHFQVERGGVPINPFSVLP